MTTETATKSQERVIGPACVEAYASAVLRVPGGQLVGRAPGPAQTDLAAGFGAPLFALGALAPEQLAKPSLRVLMGGDVRFLAMDGGRWLSLYSRVFQPTCKVEFTICAPGESDRTRPSRSILAQPPQRVVSGRWNDHVDGTSADVLLLNPLTFEELWQAVGSPSAALFAEPGRALLYTSRSLPELAVVRAMLRARNFDVSEHVPFCGAPGQTRHGSPGAWWLRASIDSADQLRPLDSGQRESFEQSLAVYRISLKHAEPGEEAECVARTFATVASVEVEGGTVEQAVLYHSGAGIDVKSGRTFGAGSGAMEWKARIHPEFMAMLPDLDGGANQLGRRFRLMAWLARALAKGVVDDEGLLPDTESPAATDTGNSEPSESPSRTEARDESPVSNDGHANPFRKRARLSRAAGVTNVLAVAARLGSPGSNPAIAVRDARRHILEWMRGKGFSIDADNPSPALETHDGEVLVESGHGVWSMRFDDRAQMAQGAFWRVELALLESEAAIGVRVAQVRQYESAPPPKPGVPKVLQVLSAKVGLHDGGIPLRSSCWRPLGDSDAEAVARLLCDRSRLHPVILIPACGELDPGLERLASRLTGVAHVVAIDTECIELMIERFGRTLSVYGSAARLYRPGFNEDADSFDHPLWAFKGSRLPARIMDEIAEEACAFAIQAADLEERVPSFQTMRRSIADLRVKFAEEATTQVAGTIEEERRRHLALRKELELLVQTYHESNEDLARAHATLREENELLVQERDQAIEQVKRLRYQLGALSRRETAQPGIAQPGLVSYPDNWDSLEEWIEAHGKGRLVVLPAAAKAARESPFEDIPFAYRVLEFLVEHYVPMRCRTHEDDDVRRAYDDALAALSAELGPVGKAPGDRRYRDEYRRDYENKRITLDMHVKRGGGFDPARLFRLYFWFDEAETRVIVGHFPTHLTNRITHSG